MTRAFDWTIGRRLGVGFAVIALTFLVLFVALWYWNDQSARAQSDYTQRVAPLDDATGNLDRRVLAVGIGVRTYLLNAGPEALLAFRTNVEAAAHGLDRLRALSMDAEGEAIFRELEPQLRRYLAEATRLVADADSVGASLDARERALTAARAQVGATIAQLADRHDARTAAAIAAMEAARERATQGMIVAVALALLLLLAIAIATVRAIRLPARDLVHAAHALESGDSRPALELRKRTQAMLGGAAPQGEMPRLALSFASAAAAIERREARLRADSDVAAASGTSLVETEVADAALAAICAHVGAEVGVLYALAEDGAMLLPIASRAIEAQAAPVPIGQGVPGHAARQRTMVVVRDIPADTPFAVRIGFDRAPPRSVVALPLLAHGALIGVLVVASLRDLDAAALDFLGAGTRQLASGLENVRAFARNARLVAELEASNARVQSQNEELQAQNEELQAQTEEIQAQNEELQVQGEEIQARNEELQQRTDQVSRYAESLAASDRRKSEFLGVLAHELRNPMAAISNGLYALSNAGVDVSMRERAEGIIRRQTRVLARLVDDLLDVTRIASGKVRLQKESVDLAALVGDCVHDHRDLMTADRTVDLRLPEEKLVVMGDRVRIAQIVGNLLDNAAKFSEKGTITVIVRHAPAKEEAELVVRDNGIGIEPAMLSKLFQPFSQADTSLARGRSGLGLGLSLVKSLVDMHAGSVHAKSEGLGTGAEFTIRLPLAVAGTVPETVPAPALGRAPELPPGAARRPRRVLIIEDNVDAAASLRDALRLLGHAVHVAHDAQAGIAAAREFRPDVVLCDIGLPTMDGYQVAGTLRADPHLRSIFLIAVTGYAGPDDQERAARAGFDRHFGKPPDIDRLNRLLEDIPLLHA